MKTSLTFDGAVLIIAEAFWWLLPYNIWLFICSKETKVSCKWSSKISMHCFNLHHQDTRTGKQDAKKKWVVKYKSQTLRLLQTGILQKHWQINLSAELERQKHWCWGTKSCFWAQLCHRNTIWQTHNKGCHHQPATGGGWAAVCSSEATLTPSHQVSHRSFWKAGIS